LEKSPLYISGVGTLRVVAFDAWRFMNPSYAAKKNVLFVPSYTRGSLTGPPHDAPKLFWR
jgi:hypothetical protein